MKTKLKNLILLLVLFMGYTLTISAQAQKKADEATNSWRYEIEVAKTGVEGTNLIKVWSYSKKPDIAIEQAKKNAIHGIIFKGFVGKAGISGKAPLFRRCWNN